MAAETDITKAGIDIFNDAEEVRRYSVRKDSMPLSSSYTKNRQLPNGGAAGGQPPLHPAANGKQSKSSRFAKNASEIYSKGTPSSCKTTEMSKNQVATRLSAASNQSLIQSSILGQVRLPSIGRKDPLT